MRKRTNGILPCLTFYGAPARCEVALPETEAFADMPDRRNHPGEELWDGTELIVQNDSLSSRNSAHGVHVFRIDKK